MLAQRGNATRCSLKRVGRSEKVFARLFFYQFVSYACIRFIEWDRIKGNTGISTTFLFFYICFFNFANSTFDVIIKLEEKRMENIEIKNIPLACIPKKATRLFD